MENARYGDLNSDIPVCLSTDTPQQVMCLHRRTGYRSTSANPLPVTFGRLGSIRFEHGEHVFPS